MCEASIKHKVQSATKLMFNVFNSQTRPVLGEQILLLEFKLQCTSDLKARMLEDTCGVMVHDFAHTRFAEYEEILKRYRTSTMWGKLRILWIQLSR